MKKLKDYVCTFHQAKSFKELGVNQDSLFYYNETGKLLKQPSRSHLGKISAYTLQELNEISKSYRFYDFYEQCGGNVITVAQCFLEYLENLRKNG